MRSCFQKLLKTASSSYTPFQTFTKPYSAVVSESLIMSNSNTTRKPRYDGRSKKRQWEERRSDKGEGLDPTMPKLVKLEDSQYKYDRIKRRKFALLMGYSGVGYYGMQRNPKTRTIEEDLFKALFTAEFITEDCYNQVQNMHFQRAARTDKGVSAARQVVSMKLVENFDLAKVNELLPETIRIFGFKRVTKGFNSKSLCDGRTYIYVIPTIAFADQKDTTPQKDFRINKEKLQLIKSLLKMYEGTKNFHNFTSKKKPTDPSAKRYIKSFSCGEPFIRSDVEFCVLKVYGQSFMLHQIRKMIGLILAVVRGMATEEIIDKALTEEKVNIPRAPGLGLVLDYVHYERYNNRYGTDGMHDKLTWEEVDKDVEEFKDKYIYPTIINTEVESESMVNWIQEKLSRHSYDETEEKYESDDECGGDDDADDQVKESKSENEEKGEEKV